MKGKLKFRFYILLFSVAIFILTAVGLAFLFYGTLVMPFWLFFAYVFAWGLVLAFAVDFFVVNAKMGWKKFLLFILIVMVLSIPVTHSVWIIVTSRWSFSVTTDKSTYRLGENIQITVSLENFGFITHSFESSLSDPVYVSIMTDVGWGEVWYSLPHFTRTEFAISPHQSLLRTFIWNQTNIHLPENEIEPGKYYINAYIPSATSDTPFLDSIFSGGTSINITSP